MIDAQIKEAGEWVQISIQRSQWKDLRVGVVFIIVALYVPDGNATNRQEMTCCNIFFDLY